MTLFVESSAVSLLGLFSFSNKLSSDVCFVLVFAKLACGLTGGKNCDRDEGGKKPWTEEV